MADTICFTETDEIENKIQIILRQTNYSEQEAREKMKEYNNDHFKVIRSFLGITEKKALPIKSLNQEIYKQIRSSLDTSMREYTLRKEQSEK